MPAAASALSPWIIVCGGEPRPRPWRRAARRLGFWLVVANLAGEEALTVAGTVDRIGPGQAYAVPPGVEHVLASPTGNQLCWFHLELAAHPGRGRDGADHLPTRPLPPGRAPIQPGWEILGVVTPPGVVASATLGRRLCALAPRLVEDWRGGAVPARLAAGLALGAWLAEWAAGSAPRGDLAPAEALVLARPADPPRLADLAAACGLGRSRFCQRWAAAHDLPPAAWARRQRLRQGAELLDHTDLPVAAVAEACGFSQASAFIRAFTRMQGRSPGAWRRR